MDHILDAPPIPIRSYRTKYQFNFKGQNGDVYRIDLQTKGYAGSPLQRNLGQAPVIRRDMSGRVMGSSLELYAECLVDQEFSELYTSDPKAWKVNVYLGENAAELIWTGFVSPELYSEPDVAPPYDVQIIATDCLGELKFTDFKINELPSISMKVNDLLCWLLYKTGVYFNSPSTYEGVNLYYINRMGYVETEYSAAVSFWQTIVDCQLFEGKTCYDVLQSLLKTFNATVTQWVAPTAQAGIVKGWMIMREADFHVDSSSGTIDNISEPDNPFDDSVRAGFIRPNSAAWQVVGQLTTNVVPAKKKVTVEQSYNYADSVLVNPGLIPTTVPEHDSLGEVSSEIPGWAPYDEGSRRGAPIARVNDGSDIGVIQPASGITMTQNVSMPIDCPTLFELEIQGVSEKLSGETAQLPQRSIQVSIYTELTAGRVAYLAKNRDEETEQITYDWVYVGSVYSVVPFSLELPQNEFSDDTYTTFGVIRRNIGSVVVPFANLFSGTIHVSVTFPDIFSQVYRSTRKIVTEINLKVSDYAKWKGAKCVIDLNNGAREELSEVDICGGNADDSEAVIRHDVFRSYRSNAITAWKTPDLQTSRLVEFIALDHALLVGMPRLELSGTVEPPKGNVGLPLALIHDHSGVAYKVEQCSWDLLNSELQFSAISAPAATIDPDSLTVTTTIEK